MIARQLEQLRGELAPIAADLAEVKLSCAVLVERSNRTEQDVRDLKTATDEAVGDLRGEVEELKGRRWPMQAVAVLSGLVGTGLALVALFVT